jgi:hypothetical protein
MLTDVTANRAAGNSLVVDASSDSFRSEATTRVNNERALRFDPQQLAFGRSDVAAKVVCGHPRLGEELRIDAGRRKPAVINHR